MTSHDLVRVQELANRFDVLTKGKISATIAADQLAADGLLKFYRSSLGENK
jgi:ABC-type sulfate/molybdate transport systems ATPase subunit